MKEKPKPTYAEIARAAGVSEATVSRVLNGDPRVHPDRVKRVKKAVDRLGYQRNRAAAALASGKTRLIAIVIEDDIGVFADPFWATISGGISRILMEHEFQTMLLIGHTNQSGGPVAHYLERGEVDGAIFFQMHQDTLVRHLAKKGLPVVMTGYPFKVGDFAFVDSDNVDGGYRASKHLFDVGCERVAIITGDIEATASQHRLQGYVKACAEVGFDTSGSYQRHGDWSFESGKAQMMAMLALKERPDGVFVANDLMARGAIAAIEDAGFACPEDIKVVGFDDSVLAVTSRPHLTSVRQDIVALGENAARLMIAQINGEEVEPVMLPTELVVRDSA